MSEHEQVKFAITDDAFLIHVWVGTEYKKIDLRDDLKINEDDLIKEFTRQPSMYAYYRALLAESEDRRDKKVKVVEMRRAEVSMQLRQGKLNIIDTMNKPMKLTEGGIEAYIENDTICKTQRQDLEAAEYICKRLKVLVDASLQRKDMLIQLGLFRREEIKQLGMSSGTH